MYSNYIKIVFSFDISIHLIRYLSTVLILTVITEETDKDIKYELFHTRSANNLSLNHPFNDFYYTKSGIHSNNVLPLGVTAGQVLNTETGKVKSKGSASKLLVRCYSHYGCFSIAEPFLSIYRPINLFPLPADILNIGFLLKSRQNPEKYEKILRKTDGTYDLLDFNPKNELKIIIHGYLEHGFQTWIKEMSIELLSKNDYNIISIDWMIGATPPYTQAVANARLVGAIIADLLMSIQKQYPGYSASKIHLIGHSLGAHIAGYVGERIPALGRITGLDPAEPYFQNTDPKVRLDSSDATFVDVIHTDASSIITGGFGMSQGCGHIDFYPNGGWKQPGCNEGPFKSVIDSIGRERNVIHGIRRFIGCNHIRAFLLFTESINTECPFMGYQCSSYEEFIAGHCSDARNRCLFSAKQLDSNTSNENDFQCLQMGFNADISWKRVHNLNVDSDPLKANGAITGAISGVISEPKSMYFLQTSDDNPFCRYHYRIKIYLKSRNDLMNNSVEKGRLFIQMFGTRGSTPVLEATKETIPLSATEVIDFLTSSRDIGKLLRIEVQLKSNPSLVINPLRWRLNDFNQNQIHLKCISVTALESNTHISFCGEELTLKAQDIKILFKTGCDCNVL